jgi:hypothetical protein
VPQLPSQLDITHRLLVHQRVRLHQWHLPGHECLCARRPAVQRVSAWVLLPRRRVRTLSRERILCRWHRHADPMSGAIDRAHVFQHIQRVRMRRWKLHERSHMPCMWAWHVREEGGGGRVQCVPSQQQHHSDRIDRLIQLSVPSWNDW